ncbi:MAG: carboxypeptidase-like regulatory domain-containing protein [Saprospiraceae bacterium]
MPLLRIKFFLLFILITASASGQKVILKKLNFSVENETIPDALYLLSEKADVNIVFSASFFNTDKKVSVNAKKQSLSSILNKILALTNYNYKAQNGSILVIPRPPKYFLISGYLKDAQSGETLPSATVYNDLTGEGVLANGYGYYCIRVKAGEVQLNFSYVGYESVVMPFKVNRPIKKEINLKPSATLQEVVVVSPLVEQYLQEHPSQHSLLTTKLNTLAAPGGEPDLLRQLQMLPGVQSGADGFGGLHVRGGNADQNLILLDDVPIFNPSHSAGLFSIFNNSLIKKATFSKGGFAAQYGGRLSSVLDVRTKEGSFEKTSAGLELGLLATTARIEMPIVKDKISFIGGIRRSHVDNFLKDRSRKNKDANDLDGQTDYYFFDAYAKLNLRLTSKDRIFLSFYSGGDKFEDTSESRRDVEIGSYSINNFSYRYDWGNQISSLRWNHLYNDRLFSNTTFIFSHFQYKNNLEHDIKSFNGFSEIFLNQVNRNQFNSTIKEIALRTDFDYFLNNDHHLKVGGGITQRGFVPTLGSEETENNYLDSVTVVKELLDLDSIEYKGWEAYFYLSDEWQFNKWQINAGLYTTVFNAAEVITFSTQPRFNVKYSFSDKTALSFSGAKMSQFLHLLTLTDAGLPNDLWVPATSKAKAENAWISTLGFHHQLGNNWLLNTEVYLKKLTGLITYSNDYLAQSSSQGINAETWEDLIQPATGHSKGWELLLEKHKGNPTGWISYTLSNTTRTILEEQSPYNFDNRHNLHLQLNWVITSNLSFNWSWAYKSGLPAVNLQQLKESFLFVDLFNSKEIQLTSDRLPAYHRMDMGFLWKLSATHFQHQLSLGVYNFYNRKNAFLSFPTGENSSDWIRIHSFPVMPSFRYVLNFNSIK